MQYNFNQRVKIRRSTHNTRCRQTPPYSSDEEVSESWRLGARETVSVESPSAIFSIGAAPDCSLRVTNSEEYINQLHCRICPDPCCDAVYISNESATTFKIESIDHRDQARLIGPSGVFQISSGTWNLQIQRDCIFQLQVFAPPGLGETYGAQIVPRGTVTAPLGKSVNHANKNRNPVVQFPRQLPSARIAEGGFSRVIPEQLPSEHIGEGGFSIVRKVYDTKLGRYIARKILKPCQGKHKMADIIKRGLEWEHEVDIHSGIRHPHIVEFLGASVGQWSIDMEFVDGMTLEQRIDNGDFCVIDKSILPTLLLHIANALEYLHSCDVVHQDIKPSNVLYDDRRSVAKLCDFGMATHVQSKSLMGGTPQYLPPESAYSRTPAKSTDVWAFGVFMLYCCRIIRLPECRADHDASFFWLKDLSEWIMARPRPRKEPEAVRKLFTWTDKLSTAAVKDKSAYGKILRKTLAKQTQRAPMSDIVANLRPLAQVELRALTQ